jgi:hypothetical protein
MTKPAKPEDKKKSPLIWVLLAVPYLALCFPQLYARGTPALLGFPFFYWYQFLWVVLTSAILGVVYHQWKEPEEPSKH